MNFYNYLDYRDLIREKLSSKMGRGAKVRLAQVLNCGPGYISQVLNKSKVHFGAENVIKVSRFLELDPTQEEFLLNLFYAERAGTEELRNYYQEKIKKLKAENLSFEKQVRSRTSELSEVSKGIYYGHWAYSFVHMLVSLPGENTLKQISQRLNLGEKFTHSVLIFLCDNGLIKKEGEYYSVGETRLHLQKSSPLLKSHHRNYRIKAIESLDKENDFDLHYSSVMTLSKEDVVKIRDLVLNLIAEKDKILIPSPNEDILCLNLDIFKV